MTTFNKYTLQVLMLSNYSFFTRTIKHRYTLKRRIKTWKNKVKESDNFKRRFNQIVFNLHREILKTSAIGKKLLTAGRTNAHLKDTYEKIGRQIEYKIDLGELDISDPKITALLHTIKACKKDLKELEEQVNKIKFSPAPEDISKKLPINKVDD
jgi:hypothetical protein